MRVALQRISSSAGELLQERPNQTMERTATRRVFPFQMTRSLLLRAALALGSGRSSISR
jgi:hypothetical protein